MTDDNEPIRISQVVNFRFEEEDPFAIYASYNYGGLLEFKASLKPKGRRSSISPFHLPEAYKRNLKVNQKKLNDVFSLMDFIPVANQNYFRSLHGDGNADCEDEDID